MTNIRLIHVHIHVHAMFEIHMYIHVETELTVPTYTCDIVFEIHIHYLIVSECIDAVA